MDPCLTAIKAAGWSARDQSCSSNWCKPDTLTLKRNDVVTQQLCLEVIYLRKQINQLREEFSSLKAQSKVISSPNLLQSQANVSAANISNEYNNTAKKASRLQKTQKQTEKKKTQALQATNNKRNAQLLNKNLKQSIISNIPKPLVTSDFSKSSKQDKDVETAPFKKPKLSKEPNTKSISSNTSLFCHLTNMPAKYKHAVSFLSRILRCNATTARTYLNVHNVLQNAAAAYSCFPSGAERVKKAIEAGKRKRKNPLVTVRTVNKEDEEDKQTYLLTLHVQCQCCLSSTQRVRFYGMMPPEGRNHKHKWVNGKPLDLSVPSYRRIAESFQINGKDQQWLCVSCFNDASVSRNTTAFVRADGRFIPSRAYQKKWDKIKNLTWLEAEQVLEHAST